MPCIDTVLCIHRLIRLFETDVSPMLCYLVSMELRLAHVYLATFTWNWVHARLIS
jgi:hypothetical protein